MATPEQVPLTLVETGEQGLVRLPVSDDVKSALTPTVESGPVKITKRQLEDHLDTATESGSEALLNGKDKLSMTFDAGQSLNQLIATNLYGKGYGAISNDQRYFIVSIELALRQHGVNVSSFQTGDQMTFDFIKGTFLKHPKAGTDKSGDLTIELSRQVTDKTRTQVEAEIVRLEKEGILYEALKRYGDDPSFAGRLKYIKEHNGFIELINHYLGESSKELFSLEVKNYGYKTTQDNARQNIAFLKAYLAVKRHEQLGAPLPITEEEPVPPPVPVAPVRPVEPIHPIEPIEPVHPPVPWDVEIVPPPEGAEEAHAAPAERPVPVLDVDDVTSFIEDIKNLGKLPPEKQLFYLNTVLDSEVDVLNRTGALELKRIRNLKTVTIEMDRWYAELAPKVPESSKADLAQARKQIDYLKGYLFPFGYPAKRKEKAPESTSKVPVVEDAPAIPEDISIKEMREVVDDLSAEKQLKFLDYEVDRTTTSLEHTGALQSKKVRNLKADVKDLTDWYAELAPTVPESSKAELVEVKRKLDYLNQFPLIKSADEAPEAPRANAGEALNIPEDIDPLAFGLDAMTYQADTQGLADEFQAAYPDYLTELKTYRGLIKPKDDGSSSFHAEFEAPDHTPYIIKARVESVDPALVHAYVEEQKAAGKECNEAAVMQYVSSKRLYFATKGEISELTPQVKKAYDKVKKPEPKAPEAAPNAKAQAEYVREAEEMKTYAKRPNMKAVNDHYQAVLALEVQGAKVDYASHLLGAQAAEALGDIKAASKAWTKAAEAANFSYEVEAARARIVAIEQSYGGAHILINRNYTEELVLEPFEPPFDPIERAAIERANKDLHGSRSFQGALPIGNYTLGGTEFNVTAGLGASTVVEVKQAAPEAAEAPAPVPVPAPEPPAPRPTVPEVAPTEEYKQMDHRDLEFGGGDVNGLVSLEWDDGVQYSGRMKDSIPNGLGEITMGGEQETFGPLNFVEGRADWTSPDGSKHLQFVWDDLGAEFEIKDLTPAPEAPRAKSTESSIPRFKLIPVETPGGTFHKIDLGQDFLLSGQGVSGHFEYEATPAGMMPVRFRYGDLDLSQKMTIATIRLGAGWESRVPAEQKDLILAKTVSLHLYKIAEATLSQAQTLLYQRYPDESVYQFSVYDAEKALLKKQEAELTTELAPYMKQ